jgi:hypothetical protein
MVQCPALNNRELERVSHSCKVDVKGVIFCTIVSRCARQWQRAISGMRS